MADDFWSGLGGLLGGGSSNLYGDLLTDKQRKALLYKEIGGGLDEISRRAAEAGKPSLMPGGKGWLGSALSGYGAGANAASEGMLKTLGDAAKLRQMRQEQAILAQASPFVQQILAERLAKRGASPPAGVPTAPPGMPAAPLTPAAPPGAAPAAAGPAGVPPPGPSYLGPTNEELGAPPLAPGATRPGGLPPRIGMRGTGPDAVMIDLDTGQPIQDAPGGPITPPLPLKTTAADPSSQFAGLLGDGSPYAQLASFPGPGPLGGSGGGGYGNDPFAGAGAMAAAAGGEPAGGPDIVIPSGPRLQRSDLTNVAAPSGAADRAADYLQKELGLQPHQARGAVKWMQNVESGLDPNIVNPTSGAFGIAQHLGSRKRELTRQYGANPSFDQQLAFIKDELQGPEKAALNALRNTSTENEAFRTWGKDFERPSPAEYAKATGQDYVIPSGRGIPASALTTVADTGAPASGSAAPFDPEALGALNALLRMGGMKSDPFGSLLETYYKSPGYLGSVKRQSEEIETEFAGKKAGAAAAATQKYIQENETHKSGLDLARDLIGKGVYFDKATGTMKPITNAAEAMAAIDAAKPTGDIKEYEYYRKQELAAGQIPEPFQKWDASRRKASATTINTAEGFEAAQTKARVGVDAKIAQDVAEHAITGRRLMPVLDELAYLADKTPEGWRGTLAPTVGKALATLGVAVPQGASNAEAFQALAQRLVPIVREPGATSQGEMALYLSSGPALSGTVNGRRLIIDVNRAMIQRSQEIAKVYRENIGKPDLYEKLAELDKPLFTDEQRAAMQGATAQQSTAVPPPAGAPAAPPGAGPRELRYNPATGRVE